MVRENHVRAEHLILPLFAVDGEGVRRAVPSMPGVHNLSPDELERDAARAFAAGVPAVLLFGLPDAKDTEATGAYRDDGIVQQAARRLRAALPDLVIITDVCLCEYTSHGHCGVLVDGRIDNDATVALLARTAVSHARAGADMVAPSDMMDLRVGAIRRALDADGFADTAIMSYAVKYASCFYGPFRDAAQCAPAFGDRRSHQMDPANSREAMREAQADLEEGADILMVKPALPCLDIVRTLRARFDCPVAAYQVSGEYAMIKAAAANGWLDERRAVEETLVCIRRAGADLIVTYFAEDFARAQRME
jgi:porphobilinogen synthase